MLALAIDKHADNPAALLLAVAATEGNLTTQGGLNQGHPGGIEVVGAEPVGRLTAGEGHGAVGGTLAKVVETGVACHQIADAAQNPMDGNDLLGIGPIPHLIVAGAHGDSLQGLSRIRSGQIENEEVAKDNIDFLAAAGIQKVVIASDVARIGRVGRKNI